MTLAQLIWALIVGLLVWGLGSLLAPPQQKHYARLAGFVAFLVIVFLELGGVIR